MEIKGEKKTRQRRQQQEKQCTECEGKRIENNNTRKFAKHRQFFVDQRRNEITGRRLEIRLR